ncbi:MAG: hypothetical protein ACI9Y7_000325 [Dokdonia sp.]|jgi:hypothetical protein
MLYDFIYVLFNFYYVFLNKIHAMRFFTLLFFFSISIYTWGQSLPCENTTIAINENGIATVTASHVLVNTTGTL